MMVYVIVFDKSASFYKNLIILLNTFLVKSFKVI